MTRRTSTSAPGGPQAVIGDPTARRAPPGLAAAVVTADGAAEFVTGGLADVGTLRPVTAQTTFLWFSMTKIVTATAVMMLADRAPWTWRRRSSSTFPRWASCAGPGR